MFDVWSIVYELQVLRMREWAASCVARRFVVQIYSIWLRLRWLGRAAYTLSVVVRFYSARFGLLFTCLFVVIFSFSGRFYFIPASFHPSAHLFSLLFLCFNFSVLLPFCRSRCRYTHTHTMLCCWFAWLLQTSTNIVKEKHRFFPRRCGGLSRFILNYYYFGFTNSIAHTRTCIAISESRALFVSVSIRSFITALNRFLFYFSLFTRTHTHTHCMSWLLIHHPLGPTTTIFACDIFRFFDLDSLVFHCSFSFFMNSFHPFHSIRHSVAQHLNERVFRVFFFTMVRI